jgi:iron-sulfur cluster assembly accessory protein
MKYLRLMVEGGGINNIYIYIYIYKQFTMLIGCSGYQYIFKFDNQINEDDITIEKDGSVLIIDKISVPFLEGAVIDFKESMIRSAFLVLDNPQADLKCSCGTSFTPKLNDKI